MCGIAGIFSSAGAQPAPETLANMAVALRHRGPDDEGLWTDNHAGLAHRRLAIIDLGNGRQPMHSASGRTVVCFNGEIYNFRELRKELEGRGCQFRTDCDTEVLLQLYETFGPDMLARLVGMFAFAIYDRPRRRLFLARDRLGQKPLFYFWSHGSLAFASELQALRLAPGFPQTVRTQSVHDFLTCQYVPAPWTIYEGVLKLPPGSSLTVDAGQTVAPEPRPYWRPDFSRKTNLSPRDAALRLRELLTEAVRLRLVADVPLGAFLSGGTDSTVIVGLMAGLMERPVQTFTIGFEEAKYDERAFAAAAARRFGTEHHEQVVGTRDFEVVRRLVRHCGEPYSDASILPTFMLSRFTRGSVTVALSGDAADELFAGYYRYTVMRHARAFDLFPHGLRRPLAAGLLRMLPPKTEERTWRGRLRRLAELFGSPRETRYLDLISRFPEALKATVYGPALRDAACAPTDARFTALIAAATAADPTEKIAELDLGTYLPDDILTKVDIASMACSLEVRSPFLDHRVVEFAASLPWGYKQGRGGSRKRILKLACADLLPPAVAGRAKMGFGVPLARWFRGDWLPLLREVLLDPAVDRRGFFSTQGMEKLISAHTGNQADFSYALWALLLFELWCQEFTGQAG